LADQSEPDPIAVLFDRHYGAMYRYLRRRVGLPLAEDLASQVFAEALRSRARYDPAQPGAGAPWLYGIAHNLLRQHLRTEQRQLRAYARTGVDPLVADDTDAVVARVDAAAVGPKLAAALADLRSGDRDVLLLFAWADLGYGEIASALGLPLGTVSSRLSRARRHLREAFETRLPSSDGGRMEALDERT
jgi:RNA polymerase sigma-70 factor (ECF subfamily)